MKAAGTATAATTQQQPTVSNLSFGNQSFVLVNAMSKRSFQVEQEVCLPGTGALKVPIYSLRPIDKRDYQPEKEATACPACSKAFGIFRRRYPCATCGFLFCSDDNTPSLLQPGTSERLRVCVECLAALKKKNESSVEDAQRTLAMRARAASTSSLGAVDADSNVFERERTATNMSMTRSSTASGAGGMGDATASSAAMSIVAAAGVRAQTVYDFTNNDIKGKPFAFAELQGRPLLVMNVASKCGFTDKGYQTAMTLLQKYRSRGLVVVLQPCSQFKNQEDGSAEEIETFACSRMKSAVVGLQAGLILLQKGDVNGPNQTPLYTYLKKAVRGSLGEAISWNFVSFVVNTSGRAVDRFLPTASLEAIEKALLPLLYASEASFAQHLAQQAAERRAEAERWQRMEQEERERVRAAEEERRRQQQEEEAARVRETERKFKENEERFVAQAKAEREQREREEAERMARHKEESEQMEQFLARVAAAQQEQQQQQQAAEQQQQQAAEAASGDDNGTPAAAAQSGEAVAVATPQPPAAAAPAAAAAAEPVAAAPASPSKPASKIQVISGDVDALSGAIALSAKQLVLLRASAHWCTACQKHTPDYEALAAKHGGSVLFLQFDVDESEEIADELQIEAMPVVIGYRRGQKVFRVQGAELASLEKDIAKHSK